MLIKSARRAEAAAKEMLAYLNDGSASCAEMREALAVCTAFMAAGSAFQAGAARVIARAERHGDGGAQVLADAAGLSRRDAHSQVKTAEAIGAVPAVREAVESGRVSQANAKLLADAVEKTSAADVESDHELLAKAESMRPEQFAREARRWTADHQADGGESEYRRQRARRCVRTRNNDDDGMVHLRGEFDPVTGKRIANRLRAEARRLHDIDKKQTNDEQLSCNAKLTGVVYDRYGKPIWRTHSRLTVTEAQWQLLIAKYSGCFHCGANPGICQGHHIEPASRGGPTKLDNLVPACWSCHHRIHHDNWQIHKHPDGWHTLHPPDRTHHGPAHAPEQSPPLFRPTTQNPDPPPRDGVTAPDGPQGAQSREAVGTPHSRPGPAAARATLHNAGAGRGRPRARGTGYPSAATRTASRTERLFDSVEVWSART